MTLLAWLVCGSEPNCFIGALRSDACACGVYGVQLCGRPRRTQREHGLRKSKSRAHQRQKGGCKTSLEAAARSCGRKKRAAVCNDLRLTIALDAPRATVLANARRKCSDSRHRWTSCSLSDRQNPKSLDGTEPWSGHIHSEAAAHESTEHVRTSCDGQAIRSKEEHPPEIARFRRPGTDSAGLFTDTAG